MVKRNAELYLEEILIVSDPEHGTNYCLLLALEIDWPSKDIMRAII